MASDLSTIVKSVERRNAEQWEFLEEVINLDSPSFEKQLTDRVGRVFARKAEEFGFRVEFDMQTEHGDNVVARLVPDVPEEQRTGSVLVVGHMDTVFGPETSKERPFRRVGGKAYGPGILDMKTGIVIALYGIAAAMEVAEKWRTPITCIFNSDEEPGSPKSRDVILLEAPKHDIAFIMEPGTGTKNRPLLTVGRKGVGILHVRVDGAPAHAGVEPELGINSIVDMAHRVIEIAKLADDGAGTSVVTGVVAGGTFPYVVPETTKISVDSRVKTLEEQQRVLAGLQRIVETEYVPGAKAVLSGGFHRQPFVPNSASMAVAEELVRLSRTIGYELETGETGGASDGNLTQNAGVPTIDGMGAHGGHAHSDLEYIDEECVPKKTQLFAAVLDRWNAGEIDTRG